MTKDLFLIWHDGEFFGAFASEDEAYDALAEEMKHHDDVSDCQWLSEMDAETLADWKDTKEGLA